ncbi:hypothetical protein D3C77_596400 [compost metagenome]
MGERPHCRVGFDDLGQCLVFFDHVRVGDIRSAFRGAEDEAGVLHREETFGNGDIADHRQRQGDAEDPHHQPLMRQGLDQYALVPGQQAFAEGDLVLVFVFGALHEQGA